jgi:hypothetical protein
VAEQFTGNVASRYIGRDLFGALMLHLNELLCFQARTQSIFLGKHFLVAGNVLKLKMMYTLPEKENALPLQL